MVTAETGKNGLTILKASRLSTSGKLHDGDKLKWLRVRLTGKANTVFMKLPENTRKDYGECVKALKRLFFPDSKKELYVAELHTRAKRDD